MKIFLRDDFKIILIFFFGFRKYIVKVKLYRYISQKWYNSIYVLHMTSDFGTFIHVNVNLCYTFLFIFFRTFIIVIYAFYQVCISSTYIRSFQKKFKQLLQPWRLNYMILALNELIKIFFGQLHSFSSFH